MLLVSRALIFSVAVLALVPLAAQNRKNPLPERYATWIEKDAVYIITEEERKAFLRLTDDKARDEFIDEFWAVRNPSRGSDRNPYKEEHYARLQYATENFGHQSNTPGWKTDMGRAYILFGKPASHARFISGGQLYPCEVWFYSNTSGIPSIPSFFSLLFFIPEDIGEYRFYRPYLDGPMKLVRGSQFNSNKSVFDFLANFGGDLARAAFSFIPGEPVDMQSFNVTMSSDMLVSKIQNLANDPFNVSRIREMRALRSKVSSWLLLPDARPLDLAAIVLTDPLGQHWLDYAVSIDDQKLGKADPAGKQLTVNVGFQLFTESGELITEDAEEAAFPAFEELGDGQGRKFMPFEIANRIPLVPGNYKLEVQISNHDAGRTYKGEHKITIPAAGQLSLTGPLLAAAVDPVAKPDPITPFQYFGAQFCPGVSRRYARRDPLRILYQLQAPEGAPADYQIEYIIANLQYRDLRRAFTENIAASEFQKGRLLKSKSISLSELDAGDYRIVMNVRTGGSASILASATLPLRIEDSAPEPRVYFLAHGRSLASRGVAAYIRALESLAQKDEKSGAVYLRQSLEQNPANTFAAQSLVQIYFNGKNFGPITDVYKHLGIVPFKGAPETLAQISLSFWHTGDRGQAADVLNAAQEYFPKNPVLAGVARMESNQ